MNRHTRHVFRLTVAAAVLASVGVYAAEGDANKPESNIEFGLGYVDSDNLRFGQYSGLNEQGAYVLFGGSLIKREDATGTWLNLSGRNLGLESRELRFEHNRQGNWGYFIEYNEIPRFNPYTVNTGLAGIGTATQTINGTALSNVDLETKRQAVTLGFSKYLPAGWDVQVRFKNEEKDGGRQWGQGTSGTVNFLVDPINQTARQLDVILGYTGEKLQLSGGYYGTLFDNHNSVLTVPNSTVFTQMALPPGNQSHQLHLSGNYVFAPTTSGTFKVAYAKAKQDDTFFVAPTNNTRSDLGGAVDTTLVQVGIVARPMPKLSLLGNVRYEDKDDKTPLAFYTVVTPTSTLDGFNEPRSIRTLSGKLEASYALPMSFRLTGGIDYEEKHRNTFRVASVTQREETDERSYRVELRRSMSETVTGALAYVHSDRDGSPFLTTVNNGGATGSNEIAPIHLADRERDKVRLSVNWQATEQMSLQFRVDESRDNYGQRPGSTLGLGAQKGEASAYSIDAAYAFSDKWLATAWISHDDTRFEQLTRTTPWQTNLRNVGDSFGLGMRGKPYGWLEAGADLSYSNITDENQQQALAGTATDVIPNFTTQLTRLKLFAKYPVKKDTSIRAIYIYDRFDTNDWSWSTWTYSDGTRVLASPTQTTHFFGVAFDYRFQ